MTNNLQSASASILLWMLTIASASAQIIPDATLPNNTTATPNGNTIIIDGGTRNGTNLFHSFREFNLGNGSTAFFNNNADIGNIISRVTGGNLSNIDGLIRANGSANLFLINPAGIIFGPNARLNIGGSFIGTTANSIIFERGSFYSATNPDAPPLLTVNVPIGLQLSNPGDILVAGSADGGAQPKDALAVSPGRTLALVGGDVTMRGGIIAAESGRIEIGSAVRGEASLTPVDVGWRLGYERVGEFGDVRLSDRSSIWNQNLNSHTNSFPTSGIQVQGRRVVLEERSQIASLAQGSQRGGDILVNATEALEIGVASGILSQVEEGSSGNGGAIIVTAPQLRLLDGGRISSLSFGDGDGGNIEVNAEESIAIGGLAVAGGEILNGGIVSENYSGGSGGNISISTRQLNLLDGGILRSFVSPTATGNGGNINLFAAESITARGAGAEDPFNPSSGVFSVTEGNGRGGDLRLSTARLSLFQTAFIGSETEGRGKGGDISINSTDLISISSSGRITSGAFGPSDGGAVAVSTRLLRLTDGGSVGSLVNIPTAGRSLPGAGPANAGDVTVTADSIEAIGVNPEAPENFSGVSSVTFADGKGGDVTIFAGRLTVKDGATLSSTVIPGLSSMGEALQGAGSGGGGDLRVNVSEFIVVSGVNPFIGTPSNVGTLTFGDGNAGNTVLNVGRLIVENGGLVSSFTSAGGDAGQISINATESILVAGSDAVSGLVAEITADALIFDDEVRQVFIDTPITTTGNTGQLTINTNRLTVRNGARINVQHQGTGNAGTLEINAAQVFLENDASITAASTSGRGGNITLDAPTSLQLRGGSRITAEARGIGDGGNLSINAETIALLRDSNIDANALEGNGGNISITTNGLFLSPGSAITASSQLGVDGTVKIQQFGANPGEAIVDLRGDRLDASALVTVSCEDYQNSEFIVTGRGGLPPNPALPLAIHRPLLEWASPEESLRSGSQPQKQYLPDTDTPPLVEATGWIVDEDGTIILVADAPTATITAPGLIHPGCR
ncbi:MAG: filamentous hemagglutinin N-terminal domain-containing protein [Cyanobacteriota bacterium]|nr:filamentous hemagglutinin N-terminal domain-containing protein [Cyanobacteriota bacterium]